MWRRVPLPKPSWVDALGPPNEMSEWVVPARPAVHAAVSLAGKWVGVNEFAEFIRRDFEAGEWLHSDPSSIPIERLKTSICLTLITRRVVVLVAGERQAHSP